MSIPVTLDPPPGYRRVGWPGRMGTVRAVVGEPGSPRGRALLVPGLTGSKEDYFALLDDLHARGWAVAAVDLPGMYESDGSTDEQDYTVDLLADDVLALVRTWGAGAPVHLVGHSVGGLVARHAAVMAPTELASLTLYASGGRALSPAAAGNAAMLRESVRHVTPADIHRMKSDLDRAAGRPQPPPELEAFLARRWGATSPGHLGGMAHIGLTAPDLADELSALSLGGRLRILVMYGEADEETWNLAAFEELARRVATTTVIIPDAAHSPAVENPAAMVDALDRFWLGLSDSEPVRT